MNLRHTLMILPCLLVMACNPGGGPSGDTDTTTGGQFQTDQDALAACGTAACGDAFAQRIESGEPAAMHNMECVLQAMHDRTVGLYHVKLDWTFSNGNQDTDTTLFVTPSGEVEIAIKRTSSVYSDAAKPTTTHTTTLEPTERCSLASVSFFESCLAAVEKDSGSGAGSGSGSGGSPGVNSHDPAAWACVYPGTTSDQALPWFVDCKVQSPTCQ